MKVTVTIFFLIVVQICFGQFDTVKLELQESSLSLKKCEGILFQEFSGSTFSYPPSHKISPNDSLFIYNKDTIFFEVYKNKELLMKGLKLPEFEAFDTISFYKKGLLVREEVWVQQYYADSTGKAMKSHLSSSYASGDVPTWIYKREYRNGVPSKTMIKTMETESSKKVCFKTYVIRGKKEKVTSCTCHKFLEHQP